MKRSVKSRSKIAWTPTGQWINLLAIIFKVNFLTCGFPKSAESSQNTQAFSFNWALIFKRFIKKLTIDIKTLLVTMFLTRIFVKQ